MSVLISFYKKYYRFLYEYLVVIPINSNMYTKINTKQQIAERPLNSLLNISKLEKFLNTKMPDWENIFIKKIPTLIRNYKK